MLVLALVLALALSLVLSLALVLTLALVLALVVTLVLAFLLALVNYLKLDAASEAHKITSNQYEKIQTQFSGPQRIATWHRFWLKSA